jgi:protein AATF/BFR2
MDKDRIIKRTQMKRGEYKICGKKRDENNKKFDESKERNAKDYDEEIFDDQDFYNQLLRELIDRRTSDVSDPLELSRRAIEMQKLHIRHKKNVDTKASKGRKIKFAPHKPLINFMAQIHQCPMPEEARYLFFINN